jgi:DNA-directed RNA polymerase specialized sigma24 family protein
MSEESADDIGRELADAQADFKAETQRVRQRRQAAVVRARQAEWSKYKIAATMGVNAPTVDSIIKTAKREGALSE